ncbi:helix-turn-helix domain-containing protein [Alkalibacterium thalassium]|uniref:PucR C-terminal helix-turn-helix domain-containing protein n=1 Tax=Alkalibacterium thalassium TaxID=426701 RepID=A0A1G9DN50_9LACT|nr:helix-turn-helix domain-containing protein [Alkalibacterium thalassium]SDK65293.1 PucR C-terminal helix-turn-helix domain-containing protein [Alkalibacterium thalassium]
MDYANLKTLYPEAVLSDLPFMDEDTFRIPYKNKWIHIPKKELTEKEWQLLVMLKQEIEPSSFPVSDSKWAELIQGQRDLPPKTTQMIRLTQLYLEKIDTQFDYLIWIDSIRQLFEPVLDVFFISSDTCLIVQDTGAPNFSDEEITGILQTLEDDFSIRTHAYIGQFWTPDHNLYDLFKEEQNIFQQEVTHMHHQVSSLPDIALHHFTKDALAKSAIMKELKTQIDASDDWHELIQALWQSQGNISVAAKQLFIHRNTLQYRMDRFNESTGLSLKNMNELLLCYLLIL